MRRLVFSTVLTIFALAGCSSSHAGGTTSSSNVTCGTAYKCPKDAASGEDYARCNFWLPKCPTEGKALLTCLSKAALECDSNGYTIEPDGTCETERTALENCPAVKIDGGSD